MPEELTFASVVNTILDISAIYGEFKVLTQPMKDAMQVLNVADTLINHNLRSFARLGGNLVLSILDAGDVPISAKKLESYLLVVTKKTKETNILNEFVKKTAYQTLLTDGQRTKLQLLKLDVQFDQAIEEKCIPRICQGLKRVAEKAIKGPATAQEELELIDRSFSALVTMLEITHNEKEFYLRVLGVMGMFCVNYKTPEKKKAFANYYSNLSEPAVTIYPDNPDIITRVTNLVLKPFSLGASLINKIRFADPRNESNVSQLIHNFERNISNMRAMEMPDRPIMAFDVEKNYWRFPDEHYESNYPPFRDVREISINRFKPFPEAFATFYGNPGEKQLTYITNLLEKLLALKIENQRLGSFVMYFVSLHLEYLFEFFAKTHSDVLMRLTDLYLFHPFAHSVEYQNYHETKKMSIITLFFVDPEINYLKKHPRFFFKLFLYVGSKPNIALPTAVKAEIIDELITQLLSHNNPFNVARAMSCVKELEYYGVYTENADLGRWTRQILDQSTNHYLDTIPGKYLRYNAVTHSFSTGGPKVNLSLYLSVALLANQKNTHHYRSLIVHQLTNVLNLCSYSFEKFPEPMPISLTFKLLEFVFKNKIFLDHMEELEPVLERFTDELLERRPYENIHYSSFKFWNISFDLEKIAVMDLLTLLDKWGTGLTGKDKKVIKRIKEEWVKKAECYVTENYGAFGGTFSFFKYRFLLINARELTIGIVKLQGGPTTELLRLVGGKIERPKTPSLEN